MPSDYKLANQSPLVVGDEVDVFGVAGSYLGKFKVTKVIPPGSIGPYIGHWNYYALRWFDSTLSWSTGDVAFAACDPYKWVKLSGNSPITNTKGCVCKRCNSGNPWAAPNQPDGTYICYECR